MTSAHCVLKLSWQQAEELTCESTQLIVCDDHAKHLSVIQGKPKELKVAIQAQPPPSTPMRLMCSARLISLIDSATKSAAAQDSKAKSKSKKRKAAELAEPAEAAEVADAPATVASAPEGVQARMESPFLAEVVAFVSKVQRTSGVTLAVELSEEVDEALSKLRESEALTAAKMAAASAGECTAAFLLDIANAC